MGLDLSLECNGHEIHEWVFKHKQLNSFIIDLKADCVAEQIKNSYVHVNLSECDINIIIKAINDGIIKSIYDSSIERVKEEDLKIFQKALDMLLRGDIITYTSNW